MKTLPREMIREILMNVPTEWNPSARLPADPMAYWRPHRMFNDQGAARYTRRQRVLLMTVCKAWYPVAEELLYSELYIDSRRKLISLSNQLSRKQDETRSLGRLTKTLCVFLSGHNKEWWSGLSQSFPNLRTLHIACPEQIDHPTYLFLQQWLEAIFKSSTRLTYVRWEDWGDYGRAFDLMKPFSSTLSDLHLEYSGLREPRKITQKNPFTRLRRLSLAYCVTSPVFLETLEFPCLEWLSVHDKLFVEMGNKARVMGFFRGLRNQLRTLEVVFHGTPPKSLEFLEAFPRLESVIYRGVSPEGDIRFLPTPPNAPHHLQALCLDLTQFCNSNGFICQWMSHFPYSHFPKLQRFFLLDLRDPSIISEEAQYLTLYSKECRDILHSLSAEVRFVDSQSSNTYSALFS